MPRFDQTGPTGQGAMTGRKMGRCAGVQPKEGAPQENLDTNAVTPGWGMAYRRGGFGRGRGMGPGRGFGFGMWGGRRP
ncbi:MAG: hypothetical protein EOL88_01710 [Bacteroidia bacterium]|jgi:hypothetical protein|nr:DUF5320 domain-containing protein [Bacteroidales bacterium]MDY0285410.1 DUF5320 domain-containing protein [Bacteroidales bacterium]NCD40787.1 hypothetical protein [Bacteroidia bacterium]